LLLDIHKALTSSGNPYAAAAARKGGSCRAHPTAREQEQ
jgi:hypothetical protein